MKTCCLAEYHSPLHFKSGPEHTKTQTLKSVLVAHPVIRHIGKNLSEHDLVMLCQSTYNFAVKPSVCLVPGCGCHRYHGDTASVIIFEKNKKTNKKNGVQVDNCKRLNVLSEKITYK